MDEKDEGLAGEDARPDEVGLRAEELRRTVEDGRSRRRSGSVVLDHQRVLGQVQALEGAARAAVERSRGLLEQREAVLAEARAEAEGIVARAERERERLVSDTDVYRVAKRQAEALLERARADDRAMRRETDEYVDAKLANFEVSLARTSEAVRRGRERLAGRSDYADIAPDDRED